MNKAKSDWIVIIVIMVIKMCLWEARLQGQTKTASQAQNCDKFSTGLVLRVMEEAWVSTWRAGGLPLTTGSAEERVVDEGAGADSYQNMQDSLGRRGANSC
jgi:hypothetical protein